MEVKLKEDEVRNLKYLGKLDSLDFYASPLKQNVCRVDIYENGHVCIYCKVVVGHYRGEDSGAIYPEYDEECQCIYDLSSLFNREYEGLTIREKIHKTMKKIN